MTTALLIIDMQHVFLPMTDPCLKNILKLTSHFQTRSLPRIFTQHGHTAAELKPPYSNQLVRKWGPSGSIATGSKDWEFIAEIEKAASEEGSVTLVGKNTYDAFLNTDLEKLLREREVERLVVCGVMTDCCCDTTARAAFNRGFETWLVDDACGTANQEQHERGLAGFAFGFGEVVTTGAVLKRV